MHVCIDGVFYVYNLRLIYDLEAYIHLAIQTRVLNFSIRQKHLKLTSCYSISILLCLISFTHSKNVISLENEYDIN